MPHTTLSWRKRTFVLLVALAVFVASGCGSVGGDADSAGSPPVDDRATAVASPQGDDAAGVEADPVSVQPTPLPTQLPTAPPADHEAEPVGEPSEPAERPDDEPTGDTAAEEATLVSFQDDFGASVLPILADNCASCHGAEGPGASHWRITNAQDLVDTHMLIREVIETNYMPPWPASDASIAFKDNRDLRADQVQAIVDWSEAGAPIDIDATTQVVPSTPVVGLENPDLVITPAQPYAGDPTQTDDYRCVIYDPQLPDGGWITGYEFIPDQTAVVHHAVGYLIDGQSGDLAFERDGEDGKPGWTCFGGSGLGRDRIWLGWAPGQDATQMPDDAGLWIEPDGLIVIQIHYHYEGSAPDDASQLALTTTGAGVPDALESVEVATLFAPVEIPCAEWEDGPLCDRAAAMADAVDRFGPEGVRADFFNRICRVEPADFAHFTQGKAESSCTLPAGLAEASGELVAVLGHMHEIGDWMRITLNAGRPDETVLLDIPDWDFDWQYNYVPAESLTIAANDSILIECGWDRSRRDPSLEPAYILWADGTNDEMCFATLTVRS